MNSIEKQIKIADEIMEKLETFDPTCILAGGAPRDWYFGNLATDLDFFVHWRPDFEGQKWRYRVQLEKLGFKVTQKTGEGLPENYRRNPHLITVFEFKYKGEVIQVMFMDEKTFNCVVKLFPFGICQAWYKRHFVDDGIGNVWNSSGIQTSTEFEWSVKHKTLRLINDLYNDADGYIEKIRSKFPDYDYMGRS
jgi:hypothetical protein